MQAPPAWAILAAIGASGGLAGLVWFGGVVGSWACWVAGIEGRCHLFG